MDWYIIRNIKGFNYYAKIPYEPLHYRNVIWKGLKDNATICETKAEAEEIRILILQQNRTLNENDITVGP